MQESVDFRLGLTRTLHDDTAMKDLSPREIRLSVFGPSAMQQARNRGQTASVHDEDISPKTKEVATMADESR